MPDGNHGNSFLDRASAHSARSPPAPDLLRAPAAASAPVTAQVPQLGLSPSTTPPLVLQLHPDPDATSVLDSPPCCPAWDSILHMPSPTFFPPPIPFCLGCMLVALPCTCTCTLVDPSVRPVTVMPVLLPLNLTSQLGPGPSPERPIPLSSKPVPTALLHPLPTLGTSRYPGSHL